MPAETRRFADAALPPPSPKPPSVDNDCPKSGEFKLPTGVLKFVRLKRLLMLTENVRL
jgi:hypothetical protein